MKTCWVRGDLAEHGADARTCTDLVIDEVTFERHLARLFGTDPGPDPRVATFWDDLLDPTDPAPAEPVVSDCGVSASDPDPDAVADADAATNPGSACDEADVDPASEPTEPAEPGTGGLVGFRCSTIDGRPLDPTEVVVATLIGHIRRVVVGADGVVLDMGRKARCFTGARQLAVQLSNHSCVWTGCDVPPSQCQCDHLDAFNGPAKGRTDPGNGAPECGRHNRLKERGFTVVRDQRGRWHVFRPDGTEIT